MECLYCHNPFELEGKLYRKGQGKYCSYNCYHKASRKVKLKKYFERNCDYCGKFYKGRGKYFCSYQCTRKGRLIHWLPKTGKRANNWKGGIVKRKGYVAIYQPKKLRRGKQTYIRRYRLVAEFCLKRKLHHPEVIHHLNEIKTDDRPKNLYLFPNKNTHCAYHTLLRNKMIKPIGESNLPKIPLSSLPDILKS